MCPPLVIRQTSMRYSISFHTRVSVSRSTRATAWYGCEDPGDYLGVGPQRQCPSQIPRKKIRTGLNPGTGVATALTRHLLFLCVLSTFVASSDWDTLALLCGSEPESRLVERCNHYCLHSTVTSTTFLTCFTDLWITLYMRAVLILTVSSSNWLSWRFHHVGIFMGKETLIQSLREAGWVAGLV